MKIKKPHCNFCEKDLTTARVDGSVLGEAEINDITFDIAFYKDNVVATPTVICKDKFNATSNPLRYAALIETWVEETAEEVRCSLCTKAVKLVRIVPKPPITPPVPMGGPANFQQLMQQTFGPTSPFNIPPPSPTYGQNQAAIIAMLDQKFTDQELIDLLTDVDCLPTNTQRSDLMEMLIHLLYD